jgi:hypothetical protein
MNPHYAQVAERASHRCEYCQAPEAVFNFPFEVEHIVALGRGGSDEEGNWALSCRAGNLHKSDCIEAIDPQTRALAQLFHPRRQQWEVHFAVDERTGALTGLTPSGRATVERLQMNRPAQLAARMQWMRLRLFPPS